MADTRKKNAEWILPTNADRTTRWEAIHAAVLMDLRDELRDLNTRLGCWEFTQLPGVLRQINRRLEKAGLLLTKRRRRRREKSSHDRASSGS